MSYGTGSFGTEPYAGSSGGVAATTLAGGLPGETDAALSGTVKVGIVLTGGVATETDSGLAGSLRVGIVVTGSLAFETDSALGGTVVTGNFIAGGIATETDSGLAGTIRAGAFLSGGLATEADSALSLTLATVQLGLATETETALVGAMVDATIIALGQALEHDNALGGEVSAGYAYVDTTNRVGGLTLSGTGVLIWEPSPTPIPNVMLAAHAFDKAASFPQPTVVNGRPTVDATWTSAPRPRHRILVGGKDVTFFRDVPTPPLDYDLLSPLLYGPGTLALPQVFAAYEDPGVGELHWLKDGARVVQQRVDDEDNVIATDYIGFVVAYDPSGRSLSVQLGGEVSGRAALMDRPVPLWKRRKDAKRFADNLMASTGNRLKPFLGGTPSGIQITEFGGTTVLDCINQVCATAVKKNGDQFSIMPDANGDYRMRIKDTATIHATAYNDDANLRADLRRDLAEEPNRVFGTGVTPSGMRVLNGLYPGLRQAPAAPYPFHGGASFGVGTTNDDTDTGDGITVMITRLQVFGYLDRRDAPGGYDDDVADAIEALQDDADLPQTGTMTQATWKALWDLDVTGFSIGWSHIAPMASRKAVRPYKRSASGAIIGKNPDYDRRVLKRDRTVDFGTGFTGSQMRRWSRNEVRDRSDNWVGTLTFDTGALVAGDHTPGDPVTVMPARNLRPGMNIRLPYFAGGITVHVSGISVRNGQVSATVDTRARDTMQVWEVIRRNRDSRRDPARAWLRDHRASSNIKDQIGEWSEFGGLLDDDVPVNDHSWTVFPVLTGESGSIAKVAFETGPKAEFVFAVFGKKISPLTLRNLVGNPLSGDGKANWTKESVRNRLDRRVLLLAEGDGDNPCGYGDEYKSEGGTFTGKYSDAAGFTFYAFGPPVLYVAVYADRNTHIKAGRIFWPQQDPM